MSTYTQILYHIVFATKNREPVLHADRRDDLYKYIWGIIEKRRCHLYRIGGIENHIHILCSLHPAVTLSDLVKEIKTASSGWIKSNAVFPDFGYWQRGYGAFTCSADAKEQIVEYIKNQEQHHQTETSANELKRLLTETGIQYDAEYFE
jgi:putative transposase